MDNKTKVKVAVVIGIVVLAVIFILMVFFVKGNRKSKVNKNIPTKTSTSDEEKVISKNENKVNNEKDNSDSEIEVENDEKNNLEEFVSLGIRDNYIVKINSDLNFEKIKKIKNGYQDFCCGDNKIYELVKGNGIKVIEINLEDENYSEKTILETNDYGIIKNIEYYSGKLYFISENGILIEYSISESESKFSISQNEIISELNMTYPSYIKLIIDIKHSEKDIPPMIRR